MKFRLEGPSPYQRNGVDAWHVVVVTKVDDDAGYEMEILHPESCGIALYDPADWEQRTRRYMCPLAEEINNVGHETMFPDGYEEGMFRVQVWWGTWPATVDGPEEYDGGVHMHKLELKEVKDYIW